MKKIICIFLLLLLVILFTVFYYNHSKINSVSQRLQNANAVQPRVSEDKAESMKITSSVFENNSSIPAKYTCQGENINPPLSFSDIPEGTKSFILIVDDPDAPMGTWVHWTLYNIPAETMSIREHSIPQGAEQGMTSFDKPGYGGPCPPSGEHHYFFKLYALDTILKIEGNPTKEILLKFMQGHVLAQADLIGLYKKSN